MMEEGTTCRKCGRDLTGKGHVRNETFTGDDVWYECMAGAGCNSPDNESLAAVAIEHLRRGCDDVTPVERRAICQWAAAEITDLRRQLDEAREETEKAHEKRREMRDRLSISRADPDAFWAWMGDGTDNLDTLSCRVAIRPEELQSILATVERLRTALEFYADPGTYYAIGFLPDHPTGDFIDDFSDDHGDEMLEGQRPGKRARAALEADGDG